MASLAPTSALLNAPRALWRSRAAATAAEYAIGAALVVTAWSAADAPRIVGTSDIARSSATCSMAPRGVTPRWERPAPPRCAPAETRRRA